jgi:hypothetical protein
MRETLWAAGAWFVIFCAFKFLGVEFGRSIIIALILSALTTAIVMGGFKWR